MRKVESTLWTRETEERHLMEWAFYSNGTDNQNVENCSWSFINMSDIYLIRRLQLKQKEWKKRTKKILLFWTNLAKITLEKQVNTLPIYNCHSTAQPEETVRHEISMKSERGRFLEMQWPHTFASKEKPADIFWGLAK